MSAWTFFIDPANVALISTAVAIIVYSSFRSLSRDVAVLRAGAEEATTFSSKTVIAFVLLASCGLVLMFYFISSLSVFLSIMVSFLGVTSMSVVLEPTFRRLFGAERVSVPLLGESMLSDLASFFVAAAIIALWYMDRNWLLNNVIATSICVFILIFYRLPSVRVGALLLGLLFVYDIFWVFFSSRFFGDNVMVKVAINLDIPAKLVYPRLLQDDSYTLLGLGDVALPGLLIAHVLQSDVDWARGWQRGYFRIVLCGYVVGILVCDVILVSTRTAQPALLYLTPGTLLPLWWFSRRRGEFGKLWVGQKPPRSRLVEAADDSYDAEAQQSRGDDAPHELHSAAAEGLESSGDENSRLMGRNQTT